MLKFSLLVAIFSIGYYFYITPNGGLEPTLWKTPCKLHNLDKNDILHKTKILYHDKNAADYKFLPAPESFAFDDKSGT